MYHEQRDKQFPEDPRNQSQSMGGQLVHSYVLVIGYIDKGKQGFWTLTFDETQPRMRFSSRETSEDVLTQYIDY